MYKRCGLRAIFQLFGMASIPVRPLFEVGNGFSLQNLWQQSGMMWRVLLKAKLDFVNVTKLFQSVNKHFGKQKAIEFSSTGMITGRHFQPTACIWVWLMCNLSLEKVWLLIKYGIFTRLYGI